jgi:hypothetical protein
MGAMRMETGASLAEVVVGVGEAEGCGGKQEEIEGGGGVPLSEVKRSEELVITVGCGDRGKRT